MFNRTSSVRIQILTFGNHNMKLVPYIQWLRFTLTIDSDLRQRKTQPISRCTVLLLTDYAGGQGGVYPRMRNISLPSFIILTIIKKISKLENSRFPVKMFQGPMAHLLN